jgi:type IV pilus assembly protein PilN
MIKINLLPKEEQKRRAPVKPNNILIVVGAILVAAGMGYGWYWLSGTVQRVESEIRNRQAELKRYEGFAKDVEKYQAEKKRLEERIKAIGVLMAARGGPSRLLDEVSKALPNEVWLTSVSRSGKKVDIAGISFTNLGVATFMTNLGNASSVLSNVDLVESAKATVEQVPVERFSITAEVKEPKV